MNYLPQVNDYVEWKEKNQKGWVYFSCEKYVTLEIFIKPKSKDDYKNSSIHANHRVLILCYSDQWNELFYVKSRTA